jgi:hypothetical protein
MIGHPSCDDHSGSEGFAAVQKVEVLVVEDGLRFVYFCWRFWESGDDIVIQVGRQAPPLQKPLLHLAQG